MADILEQIGNRTDQAFRKASNVARGSGGNVPGFSDLANLPSPSGSDVRQSKIANERLGVATRNIVRWFLPETGIVEMYVNPQSMKYTDKKHITPTRTRGGYVIQYWGEELGKVSISGTTGSSGVEGINVLYDIYRNEQVSMDGLALAAEASRNKDAQTGGMLEGVLGAGSFGDAVGSAVGAGVDGLFDAVDNVIETGSINPTAPRPTLASIAFQTELYWSGWVYRGYFESMTVSESAEKIGMFDYDIEFTVTQKRGLRLNFMPWHRSAVNGPSNSDPGFGTPYSYSGLKDQSPSRTVDGTKLSAISRAVTSVTQDLKSFRSLVSGR